MFRHWLGELDLTSRFKRLFVLEKNKPCIISDRRLEDIRSWDLRRVLRGGVEQSQLDDLLNLLIEVHISDEDDVGFGLTSF